MHLDLSQFERSGLYLLFPDGTSLALTHEAVTASSAALLSDPIRIPPQVRKAEAFQLCSICPSTSTGSIP